MISRHPSTVHFDELSQALCVYVCVVWCVRVCVCVVWCVHVCVNISQFCYLSGVLLVVMLRH